MRRALALLCLLAAPAWAADPSLRLVSEHALEGLQGGNLSGLAWCDGALLAVSDRDDDRLYRLDLSGAVGRAEAERLVVPPVPDSGLPWGLRMRALAGGYLRGGQLDFEGLSCDARGNRYLVSEAHATVLRVDPMGRAEWLELPPALLAQARASGMLVQFNALYEGIAVHPDGRTLWLAAERQRRGLLAVGEQGGRWQCRGACVLSPREGERDDGYDYAGLAWFAGKLFTLERSAYRICQRDPDSGLRERCWSFADTAQAEPRRYRPHYSMAEALWVDAEGAWVGVDNNFQTRTDGESRPILWRFAAPAGGWGARP